jgi:hypothetical protein
MDFRYLSAAQHPALDLGPIAWREGTDNHDMLGGLRRDECRDISNAGQ